MKIRKLFLASVLMLTMAMRAAADEGMWLPMLLGQQVYNDMVKKGLKLSKEQLYSVNKASLKDAIIIFGGGCTGEIVSPQGMIFTNHHCGYGAIAAASTVEKITSVMASTQKALAKKFQPTCPCNSWCASTM